jgi:hypothetical protein
MPTDKYGKQLPEPKQGLSELLASTSKEAVERAKVDFYRFRRQTFDRPRKKKGRSPLQPIRIEV